MLYRRLSLWVLIICSSALVTLLPMRMMTMRMQMFAWEYHLQRLEAGKVKDTMEISRQVKMLRTTGGVSLHRRDGTLLLPGFVQLIDWEDSIVEGTRFSRGRHDFLLVGFSPYVPSLSATLGGEVITQLGREVYGPVARVDLSTGDVSFIADDYGTLAGKLKDIRAFWPLRPASATN